MPYAEIAGERIAVSTEYHDKDTIKQVPGSRWDPKQKMWTLPLTWAACVTFSGVFSHRAEFGPSLTEWLVQMKSWIDYGLWSREQLDAPGDPALYPFQRAGSQFIKALHRCGLFDDMGTGKTMQTIDALKGLDDPFPALIIAPNGVKRKWKREFAHWWPGLQVNVIGGGAVGRRRALEEPAHVYVINWESVRLHSRLAPYGSIALRRCEACGGTPSDEEEYIKPQNCEVHLKELNLMGLRTVVADEAHRMFDPHSKWTRATWAVGHGPSVVYRWPLTGTPMANAPDDLWSILHFIDPNEWPTRTQYIDRYCLKSWNMWGGLEVIGIRPDTMLEFHQMLDYRTRRMPKELVLPYLPPKVRDTRYCEMNAKQTKAYRDVNEQLITKLDDGSVMYASNQLVANTRLMQFSSAYATVEEDGKVRLSEPSNKLDEFDEYLDELGWRSATKDRPHKPGEPVVVFAESKQIIMLCAARMEKRGLPHAVISGGMTDDQRDNIVVAFNGGPPSILLVVIKAGGEGLDFTRSGRAAFLQRSYSMLSNKQAEDRVHRIGSEIHEVILITDFVAPDTIEEDQIQRLHEKFRRLQEIVRDKELCRRLGDQMQYQLLEQEEYAIMAGEV